MDRAHERILGTILVVAGVAILLFTFYHAFTLMEHLPSSSASHGPEAAFTFAVTGSTVTLTDLSRAGSSPITTTFWSFGDGSSSSVANTSHLFGAAGKYNISLIVEDKNGNAAD